MSDVSREVISKHCILQNSLMAGNMGDIPAYSFSGERHPTRHWGCIIWTLHETARAARVFMSLAGLDLSPGAAASLTKGGNGGHAGAQGAPLGKAEKTEY